MVYRAAHPGLTKTRHKFKKNRIPWNAGLTFLTTQTDKTSKKTFKRLTHEEFNRSFKLAGTGEWIPRAGDILKADAQPAIGAVLRPRTSEVSEVEKMLQNKEDDKEISGYTEVHLPTCVTAIQDCVIEHGQHKPACKGRLITAASLYTKWGVSSMIRLKCDCCYFVSQKHKLYREVSGGGRGRRSAEPNRSLAVGLYQSSIANAGAQRLLTSMNKTIPSPSSLQK